jgi:maltooligosyltrehalose trehalohydrolase
VDHTGYAWKTPGWHRPVWRGQTIYELHIGTFTSEGSFLSAIERLDHVVDLGAEAIEIMPIADFSGSRNWGYDGVSLYAPAHCYGRPDHLRALVDAAHQRGLLVILDVVYNHLGPSGNYWAEYAKDFFHPTRTTPWGQGINYDGPNSGPVREFLLNNAVYWLDEFKIDGLRLDATHAIEDSSEKHLLAEISEAVHARGGFLIAEDERNLADLLGVSGQQSCGFDAVWSDDFHHQVRVAVTRTRESYFASYRGTADDVAITLDHGWYYTGQNYPFWGKPRGQDPQELPPQSFVYFVENHDHVGNRACGERLEHLVPPPLFRAASALLCLSPYAPLLFMGQEWAASSPFLFFTNHGGELGKLVTEGRRREFAAAGLNASIKPEQIPDPESLETFTRSKLPWDELDEPEHRKALAFYRECLRVRKQWIRPALGSRRHWAVSVALPAVVLRYEPEGRRAVLVMVALEAGEISSVSEFPVLQAPSGQVWRPILQSEAHAYGGALQLSGAALSLERSGEPWLRFGVPGAVVFVAEDV